MNNEENHFEKLEEELRGLNPANPSEELQNRIFAIFDAPAVVVVKEENFLQWFRPIAAAAAVLAIFLGALFLLRGPFGGDDGEGKLKRTAAKEIDAGFHPVKAGNVIQSATDEGVIFDHNNEPARRVRYEYSDRYQWVDEDGNLIELSVPQERQLLVPLKTD